MTGTELVFLIVGAVAVASAVAMVLSAHAVHSALFLLLNLFALAVLYLTLGADFLFAVQIMIYAGAIMVLFMFVITLLNPASESTMMGLRGRAVPTVALCGAVLVEGALLLRSTDFGPPSPTAQSGLAQIGEAVFTRYLLPFEAVSILLLVAVVGAIVLAKRRGAETVSSGDRVTQETAVGSEPAQTL
ncbi:MAG: NADH-quinone oxidoreductase subunit J [Chloroflexota bacterium]|nr:NADH-quinone oxidoreductase subunit J [Chloroflexota bacterium]